MVFENEVLVVLSCSLTVCIRTIPTNALVTRVANICLKVITVQICFSLHVIFQRDSRERQIWSDEAIMGSWDCNSHTRLICQPCWPFTPGSIICWNHFRSDRGVSLSNEFFKPAHINGLAKSTFEALFAEEVNVT